MVNYQQTVYDCHCNKPKNSKRYFTVQKKCDKKSRPKNNVRGDDKLMIFLMRLMQNLTDFRLKKDKLRVLFNS